MFTQVVFLAWLQRELAHTSLISVQLLLIRASHIGGHEVVVQRVVGEDTVRTAVRVASNLLVPQVSLDHEHNLLCCPTVPHHHGLDFCRECTGGGESSHQKCLERAFVSKWKLKPLPCRVFPIGAQRTTR